MRYDFLMVWGDVLSLLCRNVRWKISAHIDEGLGGGSRVHRPGRKDPHQREPKFKSTFNQIFFLLLKLLKRIAGGGVEFHFFFYWNPSIFVNPFWEKLNPAQRRKTEKKFHDSECKIVGPKVWHREN